MTQKCFLIAKLQCVTPFFRSFFIREKKTPLIIQCYQERFTAVGRGHFDVDVGLAGDEPVDVALQLLQRRGSTWKRNDSVIL